MLSITARSIHHALNSHHNRSAFGNRVSAMSPIAPLLVGPSFATLPPEQDGLMLYRQHREPTSPRGNGRERLFAPGTSPDQNRCNFGDSQPRYFLDRIGSMPISVAQSPLDLIGNTPVVRLNRIPGKDDAEIWAKLENFNPGGSVKDRICLAMVEAAEKSGRLKPGDTIVEPTSGNTGIGLALVAAVKGYKLILTMPDTMSEERRSLLVAYGAKLVLTPDTRGMHGAIAKAEELCRENPGYFMPQQFSNTANPDIHYRCTGPELLQQFKSIDAFVAGVGTGGTITGAGHYLREHLDKRVLIVAVEPKNSQVLSGGEPGFHKIQGIGAGFIPSNLDTKVYDEIIPVSDEDATLFSRRLAREEGMLVGISSGANCYAALQVAKRLGKGNVVVVVFCDTGERYLTTDLFQAEGI
jgi:cysteine synthase A